MTPVPAQAYTVPGWAWVANAKLLRTNGGRSQNTESKGNMGTISKAIRNCYGPKS